MNIYGKNLYLRSIVPEDLEFIFKGLSDPNIYKYYGVSFDSLEATKTQMQWFSNLEKNKKGKWWIVCLKGTYEFLGAGGINNVDYNKNKAEIGFWLLPEYWGKGFMEEAFPLILNYSFEAFKLKRIEGFVETENKKCKRALVKTNFCHDKTAQIQEFKNGKSVYLDTYYITKK